VNGDTWNWTAESKMGDAKISVRVTIKQVSKTEYTFKLEMSQNGGEFSVVEEVTGHKVTAAAPAKKS
jgi:acyl-CoA thioesterase FadM